MEAPRKSRISADKRALMERRRRENEGFAVTVEQEIGRVVPGRDGAESPMHAAMGLVANHVNEIGPLSYDTVPGVYYFPVDVGGLAPHRCRIEVSVQPQD
jgi:hypothetical protein